MTICSTTGWAQNTNLPGPSVAPSDIEEVVVIGVTPGGAGLDRNRIPFPIQTASAEDIQNNNGLGLADYLRQNFLSVSLNDAQNNPLQQDLQYRGYTASPLLGLAQGIAVYQNGVRINEPLGDSVNWDLIPDSAVNSVTISGGSNPLFGLNTLGGSLIIDMKNGFTFQGTELEIRTGSFNRSTASFETGGNNGSIAYYGNVEYYQGDGWRDLSESDAINFYGSVGWQAQSSQVNVNYQYGTSDLTGNGAAPAELLALDREAIFTGPDTTANDMNLLSLDFQHTFNEKASFSGNVFYRKNNTDSFNGDGSEFAVCELGEVDQLIEGLEEDDLEELGLDDDDVCQSQFTSADALQQFLNATAAGLGLEEEFNLEDFTDDELSGTGLLSDDAINNISDRSQESMGLDYQWTFNADTFGYASQTIVGLSYFKGKSVFNSVLELAELDPISRLTSGLGVGTFVDEQATSINTETKSESFYITTNLELTSTLALTLSARMNNTDVKLRDRSGERPELNGKHDYFRINPALGLTWQPHEDHNLYTSYSESSRAPTPIELACNEGIFQLAVAFAIEAGEDPDDVELECRLPNAFLADPPLDDVVAKSLEIGARGMVSDISYRLGFFHTINRDDILFQTTGRATGLFANVDKTRRRGLESSLQGQWRDLSWFAAYSYVDASFEDNFQVLSPNHAFADAEGEIFVRRGDRMPGIPQHQFKLGADYQITDNFSWGLDLLSNGDQVLRGDESNQLDTVDGYSVLNLRTRYQLSDKLEIVAKIDNLLDREYESFGLLGEDPSELDLPIFEDMSDPRFLGAGAPRAAFVGIRYRF